MTVQEINKKIKELAVQQQTIVVALKARAKELAKTGESKKTDDRYQRLVQEQQITQLDISKLRVEKGKLEPVPNEAPKTKVIVRKETSASPKGQYVYREFMRLVRKEIGDEKYRQLLNEALESWNKFGKKTDFEKMMRNNSNSYAGDNV